MTAYNREKYVADAISSVLNCQFSDFELIFVDDCSTDRTAEIAWRFSASDPRMKVYINEKNLGDYNNRNRAASFASGKYIKYLDSDDYLYPHGLQIMVESMERFPDAAVGLGRPSDSARPFPFRMEPVEVYRQHFLGHGVLCVGPSGTIIRRDRFIEAGGFSGKRFIGDEEFWLKLAAKHPIVLFQQDSIWYRRHTQQEYAYADFTAYSSQLFNLQMAALDSEECPLSTNETQHAKQILKRRLVRGILRAGVVERDPRKALVILRQAGLSLADLSTAFDRRIPDPTTRRWMKVIRT